MKPLYLLLGVAVAVKGASVAVTPIPGSETVTLGNELAGFDWKYAAQAASLTAAAADWAAIGGGITYPDCGGSSQSPIDVVVADLESTKDDVGKVWNHLYELDITGDVINTGRHLTYQITEGLRPYISGGPLDTKYVFDHMDFHFGSVDSQGSEHTVDGSHSPGEIYLVFYDGDDFSTFADAAASSVSDALATVSYMVKTESTTAENADLKTLIDALATPSGVFVDTDKGELYADIDINLEKIFGLSVDDYYYYDGSLTTPGCTENVKWILSNKKIELSTAQMNTLRAILTPDTADVLVDNFRPTQTLGSRTVYWRRATIEIDPAKAQILGASIIGAGVFHHVYTLLQQPETAKALRENALVDFMNNIPAALLGEPEVVQQRSSEEAQFVQPQPYHQPVYQPQQYQQYVPQVAPVAAPATA